MCLPSRVRRHSPFARSVRVIIRNLCHWQESLEANTNYTLTCEVGGGNGNSNGGASPPSHRCPPSIVGPMLARSPSEIDTSDASIAGYNFGIYTASGAMLKSISTTNGGPRSFATHYIKVSLVVDSTLFPKLVGQKLVIKLAKGAQKGQGHYHSVALTKQKACSRTGCPGTCYEAVLKQGRSPGMTRICPSGDGKYALTGSGSLCNSGLDIKTVEECKKAATAVGKAFAGSWSGPGDHPYCLLASDGRDKVFFNTHGSPGGAARKYQSLCRAGPKPFMAQCDDAGFMKVLQLADSPYTPSSAGFGNVSSAAGKLSDAQINSVGTSKEFRMDHAGADQCKCSGVTNKAGLIGPDCKSLWQGKHHCYVKPGVCKDGKKSAQVPGAEWSFMACSPSDTAGSFYIKSAGWYTDTVRNMGITGPSTGCSMSKFSAKTAIVAAAGGYKPTYSYSCTGSQSAVDTLESGASKDTCARVFTGCSYKTASSRANRDFTTAGGSSRTGRDIRSGNPHQHTTATLPVMYVNQPVVVSSIRFNYEYVVGYGSYGAKVPPTIKGPQFNVSLVDVATGASRLVYSSAILHGYDYDTCGQHGGWGSDTVVGDGCYAPPTRVSAAVSDFTTTAKGFKIQFDFSNNDGNWVAVWHRMGGGSSLLALMSANDLGEETGTTMYLYSIFVNVCAGDANSRDARR